VRARARISRVFARKLPSSGRTALPRSTAPSRYRVMHNASPPFPHPRIPACLAPARNRRDKNKPPMTVTANDPPPSRSRDLWPNFDAPISAYVRLCHPPPLARSFPAKYVTRANTSVPFHRAASPSREIRGVRNAARGIDGSVVCCIVASLMHRVFCVNADPAPFLRRFR